MAGRCADNRRHDRLAILLLAALALAFWGNCIFGGKVPVAAVYQKQMLPWSAIAQAGGETRQWDSLLWDSMAQFYPWRLLLHRAAQSDQLPLWNPYQFCGYPFVGNGQSAMFYPLNWLYFLVHPKVGLGLSAALHFFLGGLFVFGLARSWRLGIGPALFAALAFTYGGFMVTWIELPTLPNSLIWLPLAWWGIELILHAGPTPPSPLPEQGGGGAVSLSGAERSEARERGRGEDAVRGLIVLAIALGMTLLAGHFQIAAYVWIFAGLYAVIRLIVAGGARRTEVASRPQRDTRRLGTVGLLTLAAVLALMLAMAQLLPTLELGKYSARGAGGPSAGGFEFHRQRALQPVELLTLLMPDFLGSPVTNDYAGISYSEHCGFVGAITLLLGLAGLVLKPRRGMAWLFGGIALFTLWGAMAGPPAMLLYWGVPKLGQAGGFARLLSVWTLAAALWGGVGLQAVIESLGSRGPSASAGRSAARSAAPQPDASASGESGPSDSDGVRRTLGGAAAPDEEEGGAAADRGLKPSAGGPATDRPADGNGDGGRAGKVGMAVGLVAIALLLVQVLPWAYRFNPRAKAEDVYPETELIRQLQWRLGSDRYVAINDRQAWGLTQVPANVILPPNAATVYGLRCVDGYDSLFPALYRDWAAREEHGDPSPLTNGNMLLLENDHSWFREYRVATRELWPPGALTVWEGEGVKVTRFHQPGPRAHLWSMADALSSTIGPEVSAQIVSDGLNSVQLDLTASWSQKRLLPGEQPELLLRDTFYPGWRVTVDGHERAAWPMDAFRSVPVSRGTQSVEMLYFPASVACGLFVSLLALMVLSACAVSVRRYSPSPAGRGGRGVRT